MNVEDLQKALDKFPELHDNQYWKLNVHDPDAVSDFLYGLDEWLKEFKESFSVFIQEQELTGYLSSPRTGVDKDIILISRKQLSDITEGMILGQPAIFPYIETDFDKGYSKGYYAAKGQVEENLKELLEESK